MSGWWYAGGKLPFPLNNISCLVCILHNHFSTVLQQSVMRWPQWTICFMRWCFRKWCPLCPIAKTVKRVCFIPVLAFNYWMSADCTDIHIAATSQMDQAKLIYTDNIQRDAVFIFVVSHGEINFCTPLFPGSGSDNLIHYVYALCLTLHSCWKPYFSQ